jgi:hypothetical protein
LRLRESIENAEVDVQSLGRVYREGGCLDMVESWRASESHFDTNYDCVEVWIALTNNANR